MKISKTTLNVALIVLGLMLAVADHLFVVSAEQTVIANCNTRVAYDKSGTMYCVDTSMKSEKVAQR